MREIVEDCKANLHANLYNKYVSEFFNKRHLTKSDIDTFDLGYAHKTHILGTLMKHRLVFPMSDKDGIVNSLSCRVLDENDIPKVLTPTKDGFRKPIYGLNLTQSDIKFYDQAILVEGQMDYISLYKHSFTNVVALAGSDLTNESAMEVFGMTKNWIYALDNDEAGKKAVLRNVFRHFDLPLNIRVQTDWDDCKDPDEFIWKYGSSATAKKLNSAKSLIEYLLQFHKAELENNLISVCSDPENYTKSIFYAGKLNCDVESVKMGILKKTIKSFANAEKYCYIIDPQSKSAVDYGIAYFTWKGKQTNVPCDARFPKFDWLTDKRVNSKRLSDILYQLVNK
jgi:DNA primase